MAPILPMVFLMSKTFHILVVSIGLLITLCSCNQQSGDGSSSDIADASGEALVCSEDIQEGSTCNTSGQSCLTRASGDDCSQLMRCVCDGTSFRCAFPYNEGQSCEETLSCYIEGTGSCDVEPAGGGCSCSDGEWNCWSGCPLGCPNSRPMEGEACTSSETEICRYSSDSVSCSCVNDAFTCQ